MVEEKVKNLIYSIKKYKSLFEAEFIKYFLLSKVENNSGEIKEKKSRMVLSPISRNNHDIKNSFEEENSSIFKKTNIMSLQFNSEVINQPKYNIIN